MVRCTAYAEDWECRAREAAWEGHSLLVLLSIVISIAASSSHDRIRKGNFQIRFNAQTTAQLPSLASVPSPPAAAASAEEDVDVRSLLGFTPSVKSTPK